MKYTVAVRALCEFTAKCGDLDLRFTPAPTAQEGIAGHQWVVSRRGAAYEAEVPLSGSYGPLQVRGRADGYDPLSKRLEEIKTYRGDLARMPENHRQLHWAQVRIYGWLLCQSRGLQEISLSLVYLNVLNRRETCISETWTAVKLQEFFEQQCERFLAWADQELAHRQRRDHALSALSFPYTEFRSGQRQLAEAVYRAASGGYCLLAEAPTGIGKTLGTLFPMLKAMPLQGLDKVFYLAAKTPGRRLALDALVQITGDDAEDSPAHGCVTPAIDNRGVTVAKAPLRVLELVAREKSCEHPDKSCHGDSCPLAQGFYDRLPAARQAAAEAGMLDQSRLREIALAQNICPYYLAQEMARWSDVVVGDYNYYFDQSALLHGLTQANQWRVALLVDEAHNLIERGRGMYSATLSQSSLAAAKKAAPPTLRRPLGALYRHWRELLQTQTTDYQTYEVVPQDLLNTLQQAVASLTDYFSEHPQAVSAELQNLLFDALQFGRLAEVFDQHFICDVQTEMATAAPGRKTGRNLATLNLRNVLPGPFLGPRLETAQASVLFSATLRPWHFYHEMLGLPATSKIIQVDSPFSAAQLAVRLVPQISTRFQHRRASCRPIADLLAHQFQQMPGNYLAFFSSFDYLQDVAEVLARRYPAIPLWRQERRMDESARQQFLQQFRADGQGIGFAVLGGAFGEGIDLAGERLIGAFIATLGLPQINPVNEAFKQRLQQLLGRGQDYTYFYPGMQKVVQAAGRVIRGQQDRGVVYLIDDRFAQQRVRQLLPEWWQVETAQLPAPAVSFVDAEQREMDF